ncbi:MAG TPA: hypothetical protein VMA13_10020 [Candidatus Saccharimonadales bacterium]|nr:hypothetical protein [Candidatus Saccharimonadales bacterium]
MRQLPEEQPAGLFSPLRQIAPAECAETSSLTLEAEGLITLINGIPSISSGLPAFV